MTKTETYCDHCNKKISEKDGRILITGYGNTFCIQNGIIHSGLNKRDKPITVSTSQDMHFCSNGCINNHFLIHP